MVLVQWGNTLTARWANHWRSAAGPAGTVVIGRSGLQTSVWRLGQLQG